MRRRKEEQSKYQHIINQLLTLFFSGTYISSNDMMNIANKMGYEMPSKSREIFLKNLFLEAEKDDKLDTLFDEFIKLLMARINEYKSLNIAFPSMIAVSSIWMQRANSVLRLLQQQKYNPYA